MVGESIEESSYIFTVEKLEGHRIAKVHVEKLIESSEDTEDSTEHGEGE
jgi:CBS domain containing-hemolysin-like protein